mgnify:CR=1 FL=1
MPFYRNFRAETFEQGCKNIKKLSKQELVKNAINGEVNSFLSHICDNEDHAITWGKAIPYIGWFWRDCDFYNKTINIGNCWYFIGIMENNKRDYPERELTEKEFDQVMKLIREAKRYNELGGDVTENDKKKRETIEKLRHLIQTFKIK